MIPALLASALVQTDRVAVARDLMEARVKASFARAKVPYPAPEMYLRAFKEESRLEMWAAPKRGTKMVRVASWPVLRASGGPGPKRKQGDLQVPEGFYEVDVFNPRSQFLLSFRVSYPNASDRVLSDPVSPGGDIYIHGKRVSIGCLAMGDEAIQAIYLAVWDAHASGAKPIRIDIYPSEDIEGMSRQYPELAEFWRPLGVALRRFDRTKRPAAFRVAADGRYVIIKF
jgi:murein L,D-transpeptidase YafK